MDLGYTNDIINSTTDRMATEDLVFSRTFLSYGVGIMLEKMVGICKVGVVACLYFPCEIIYP